MTKIFGMRFSLIGDIIMSLPMLPILNSELNGIYTYFSIAKKCEQAAPLFKSQPFISEIKISDYEESLGENDLKIVKECDIVFNVAPQHPREYDWYNYRSCIEETALMAGLNPDLFKEQFPKLNQYWASELGRKAVAIWPFAGYGKGASRSPSKEWWEDVIHNLSYKYEIFHFGSEIEPTLSESDSYKKFTNLSFFEQIKATLECSACIGTDSGSMWCIGAYQKIPQLNLLTNWLYGHNRNPLALAPVGPLALNAFSENGCSNIDKNVVYRFVYDHLS